MLIPLYLLTVLQLSPSRVGLLLASGGIGALCAYPWRGMITERFGSRRVSACGALVALLGSLALAGVPPSSLAEWLICLILFVRAVGMSSISIPSISAAYSSIPKAAVPVSTTTLNIVQRIGGPVATTIIAIFLHRRVATQISTGDLVTAGAEACISAQHFGCAAPGMRSYSLQPCATAHARHTESAHRLSIISTTR
jgi:predicted MFS family arabinose efflux permease